MKQIPSLMTKAEQLRLETISKTKANRMALNMEITRRMAKENTQLHLTVDTTKHLMFLASEGAQLRAMNIKTGKDTLIGSPPDRVRMVLPAGKRLVTNVVDDTYVWTAPAWVYAQRKQRVPTENALKGGLGSLAIFLDSGTVIYSRPEVGPLNDDNYVLPGSIQISSTDVKAIRKAVQAGMVVYFY